MLIVKTVTHQTKATIDKLTRKIKKMMTSYPIMEIGKSALNMVVNYYTQKIILP